ncbi:MAG TPA: cytochrome P450 [Clostridia bacterium]|nr:cytochrome P450 [Clostridia bacterium]
MSSEMTSAYRPAEAFRRGSYHFPHGLKHNLLWYGARRLRPLDPLKFFSQLAREFGDIAHYQLGAKHIVFLSNPEYIREVLIVQHSNFIKERTQQRARILLGEGMITADGAVHRKQRQVAQPAFHRQQVPAYVDEIVRRAAALRDRWREDETLDVYREMMHLTLGTVSATLFNFELGEEVVPLNAGVGDIMQVYNALVLLPGINLLLGVPFTPLRKFVHARARLDATISRMIAERRKATARGAAEGRDLLPFMLASQAEMGWTDRDLRDQVITIFLAGYETMAIALTWTWYVLSQNPDARERMYAEVDAVLGSRAATCDDLPKLRYTEMVLAESMRLYPPAWAMGRQALADFELGPYRLPAGTTVLMSQFVTHRDPRYYPKPLRFDPERFTPEAKAARPRFSYFPFGMGPRQCIGEAFAWMEGVLVLATFAQRWRLEHVEGHKVEPQPLFTLRPKNGMPMRVAACR